MSTPRDYTLDLVAGTPRELGAVGRFFGIIEAPASAIDVSLDGASVLRRAAGGSILVAQPFQRIRLSTVANQTVRILVADEVQDVSGASAGGASGSIATTDLPADSVSDIAPVVVVTATEAALFAANLARRRIAVHVDSANAGSCYARPAGASVNNIAELQPGVVYNFAGLYGLDVRNDTGANATFYIFEES